MNFDSYFSGTAWTSSYLSSNYQIQKTSNQLQFNYSSAVAAGSILAWTTAGYVDTSGILQWSKPIKTSDTTASSSITTGAIVSAGGLGVTVKAYIGDSVLVNTTSTTAKIVVSGGVQNIAGYETCIRASSALTAANIEIQNTAASGKLYELRSTNTGTFDIIDRTGGVQRLTISTTGVISVPGTISINKGASAPICALEVVGAICSSNNGGTSDKELTFDCATALTYSVITSYQQTQGDRDLFLSLKNLAIGASSTTPSFGGATGGVFIANRLVAPSSNPALGGILYAEAGSLKWRGSSGTVTIIAAA